MISLAEHWGQISFIVGAVSASIAVWSAYHDLFKEKKRGAVHIAKTVGATLAAIALFSAPLILNGMSSADLRGACAAATSAQIESLRIPNIVFLQQDAVAIRAGLEQGLRPSLECEVRNVGRASVERITILMVAQSRGRPTVRRTVSLSDLPHDGAQHFAVLDAYQRPQDEERPYVVSFEAQSESRYRVHWTDSPYVVRW